MFLRLYYYLADSPQNLIGQIGPDVRRGNRGRGNRGRGNRMNEWTEFVLWMFTSRNECLVQSCRAWRKRGRFDIYGFFLLLLLLSMFRGEKGWSPSTDRRQPTTRSPARDRMKGWRPGCVGDDSIALKKGPIKAWKRARDHFLKRTPAWAAIKGPLFIKGEGLHAKVVLPRLF